ncbi:MAG: peptide deformylase [Pseudomonadota bacterium]
MAKRDILTIPDQVLRQASKPVDVVDDDVRALVKDMFETMYDAPGVGLAAIQIGVPLRIVTTDAVRGDDLRNPIAFINPEITWQSDTLKLYEEGCLSIPDYFEDVERPECCKVSYLDENGETQERLCEDLLATVIQHEVDHLDGILFIDHLSRLKRERIVRKFTKMKKRSAA